MLDAIQSMGCRWSTNSHVLCIVLHIVFLLISSWVVASAAGPGLWYPPGCPGSGLEAVRSGRFGVGGNVEWECGWVGAKYIYICIL